LSGKTDTTKAAGGSLEQSAKGVMNSLFKKGN
jgi:hypothetical protein